MRHGLTLDPGGQCLLCRREHAASQPQPLPIAVQSGDDSRIAVRAALVLLALGSLAAAAVVINGTGPALRGGAVSTNVSALDTSVASAKPEPAAIAAPAVSARGIPPKAATPEPSAASKATPTATDGARPTTAAKAPEEAPNRPQAASALQARAEQAASPSAAAEAAQAEEDRRRHEEVMAAIADRERARATSSLSITMYSTSWCGACKAAREHMRTHGIAFTDLDVEQDPAAEAQHLLLNPRGSVPTIDVDGKETLVGFSASSLDSAIDRATAAHGGA